MMKHKYYFLLICAFIAIGTSSCKEDEGEIGEPFSKIEGLTATGWIVEEVFLVDDSNPARPERDISNYYTTGTQRMEMQFSTDGTFTVAPGDGLNFFPLSGTWSFDDNFAPTKIYLEDTNGVVTEAPLAGPTRISDAQLKIQIVKEYCQIDGVAKGVLGYRIVFNRSV